MNSHEFTVFDKNHLEIESCKSFWILWNHYKKSAALFCIEARSLKENGRNKDYKIDHQNLKWNIKEALRWGETEKESISTVDWEGRTKKFTWQFFELQ
jgi:hypothetical protein